MWHVPLVVFCVLASVLAVSTIIVVACLKKETKKFHKKLVKGQKISLDLMGITDLEKMMMKYVSYQLTMGMIKKIANSLSKDKQNIEETLRLESDSLFEMIVNACPREQVIEWFQQTAEKLRTQNLSDKMIRRRILTGVRYQGIHFYFFTHKQWLCYRAGLVKHPMDIRGSRRAFEAARIFLSMDNTNEAFALLPTQVSKLPSTVPQLDTCPTYPCTWVASKLCLLFSLCLSHPGSAPVLAIICHLLLWCYELLTDLVFINNFWQFRIPVR